MFDEAKFLATVNKRLFGGKMDESQAAGIKAVLEETKVRGITDLRYPAYMLGTMKVETNATMQPVREAYWLSENWRRINLRYWPYYGRGLVQITWLDNYRKMTKLLRDRFIAKYPDFDLVKNPDQALIPEIATAIMFEGMMNGDSLDGDFTGLALEDFFTSSNSNWIGARKIINGTDRDVEIAGIAQEFYNAFLGKEAPPRILEYGMHGPDVFSLQAALSAEGFYKANIDDDFGRITQAAVKAFQKSHGLVVDGKVGPITRAALKLK